MSQRTCSRTETGSAIRSAANCSPPSALDDQDQPYYITLKLDPAEGDFLRGQYEDILPGYYMNKTHWNSVRAQGSVPDDLLRNLLDEAYRLVLHALPKKKQREITGE